MAVYLGGLQENYDNVDMKKEYLEVSRLFEPPMTPEGTNMPINNALSTEYYMIPGVENNMQQGIGPAIQQDNNMQQGPGPVIQQNNTDNNRLKLVESWYRKVTQRTKSPELRLGKISMLLVSGRTEKHLYFRAEKLRRIKSRG